MAKIIIVDDIKEIRESAKAILKGQGYKVLEASNGRQLIKLLEKNNVDLILLDIMMSKEKSDELMSLINKKHPSKIILFSVVKVTDDETRLFLSKSNNIVDFIQEPFDTEDVKYRVKKALVR